MAKKKTKSPAKEHVPLSTSRFIALLRDCVVNHGYRFQFVANGNTCRSPNPTDLRSYGAIYWKAKTGSLWCPICVVNMVHFRRPNEPRQMLKHAVSNMELSPRKAKVIKDACLACPGHNRNLRRRILRAVDNCVRTFD